MSATASIADTIYYGTFIDTPQLGQLRIRHQLAVKVDSHGTIVAIGQLDDVKANDDLVKVVELAQGQWVFPGFIDTHIHAPQYPNIGVGLGIPLLKWLDQYTFKLEKRIADDNELAKRVYHKVVQRTLGSGTTWAAYFATIDSATTYTLAEEAYAAGQRALVGKVCMDTNPGHEDYQELLESCQKLLAWLDDKIAALDPLGKLVAPIVTPRFAPVCTRDMLTWLGDEAATGKCVQTHMCENLDEIDMVLKQFSDCKLYAHVYDRYHLLTDKTVLAHCVHMSADDIARVKANHSLVSHCPTSNTFLSSGNAPVRKYLYDDKLNVALGTDVLGGYDALMLSMVKQAVLTSHQVAITLGSDKDQLSVAEALYLATVAGAKLFGSDGRLGLFDQGKQFDAQLIDLAVSGLPVDTFEWENDEERVSKWVFGGDDRNCVVVWVDGRRVVSK